jgi:hypothetical protein
VRVWAIVAGLSLVLTGASLANPQDSPGTVYIDGLPCNLACQSYMAWSRQSLKSSQTAGKGAANTSVAKASRQASHKRISKRTEPASTGAPSSKKTGDAQAALTTNPEPPPPIPKPRTETAPVELEVRVPPVAPATAPEPSPAPQSKTESVPLNVETSSRPRERTPQELVTAALAVAQQMTSAEPLKTTGDDRTSEAKAGDANLPPSQDIGSLVAIVIAAPGVKSASALKGQNVAVDASQSDVQQDIRFALAAAGAIEAQLSVTDASPIDRIVSGDVEAAVVKLVSRDAAEAFPDIKGFRVFRVPLTPR